MLSIHQIAETAHEVNRAYCAAIGDHTQPNWDNAPDWQKESAVKGVLAHMGKNLTPAESHQLWLDEKRMTGWKYGPVKDAAKREHPCFRPYDELPQEQRVKDYLFSAVVRSLKGIE